MSSESLKRLKCALLVELNRKPYQEITDNEAQLTYYLSQDPDVQQQLSSGRNKDV